jgi:antitoxin component YwqK of YwqJK toxin-antitoxin module
VSFYEDGQKASVAHFTEGFCTDGTEYYKDGKVQKTWVNKRDGAGVQTEYETRDASGNVVEMEKGRVLGTDSSGQRTGPWIIVNGKERSEGSYEEGKRTGAWTHIRKDGGRETGSYLKGEQSGPWRFHSSTGGLSAVGSYKDGRQHGRWEFYDSKGRNSSWTVYEEGRSVNSGSYKN